jgi:hypothetical protein
VKRFAAPFDVPERVLDEFLLIERGHDDGDFYATGDS